MTMIGPAGCRRFRCAPWRLALFTVIAGLSTVPARAADEGPAAARPDQDTAHCGSYCLMTALESIERGPTDWQELESVLGPVPESGYSLRQLHSAAEHFGAAGAAVRTSPGNLLNRRERFACIAVLNEDHYVLLADIRNGTATIIDPPGSYDVPLATLMSQWDGTALLIADRRLESETALSQRLRREQLARRILQAAGGGLVAVILIGCGMTWRRRHGDRGSRQN